MLVIITSADKSIVLIGPDHTIKYFVQKSVHATKKAPLWCFYSDRARDFGYFFSRDECMNYLEQLHKDYCLLNSAITRHPVGRATELHV
jgi:hypothetical protein